MESNTETAADLEFFRGRGGINAAEARLVYSDGTPIALIKRFDRQPDAAVATWRDEGQSIGMTSAELDQFADAFEHSAPACGCGIE